MFDQIFDPSVDTSDPALQNLEHQVNELLILVTTALDLYNAAELALPNAPVDQIARYNWMTTQSGIDGRKSYEEKLAIYRDRAFYQLGTILLQFPTLDTSMLDPSLLGLIDAYRQNGAFGWGNSIDLTSDGVMISPETVAFGLQALVIQLPEHTPLLDRGTIDNLASYTESIYIDERLAISFQQARNLLLGWNGAMDNRLLIRLGHLIRQIPVRVLGIDVGVVSQAFQAFHDDMSFVQENLSALKATLALIDEQLLDPQVVNERRLRNLAISILWEVNGEYDMSWDALSTTQLSDMARDALGRRTLQIAPGTEILTLVRDETGNPILDERGQLQYISLTTEVNYYQQKLRQLDEARGDLLGVTDRTHEILLILFLAVGFVPIVGQVVNVLDALVSLGRGDLFMAALTLINWDELIDILRVMRSNGDAAILIIDQNMRPQTRMHQQFYSADLYKGKVNQFGQTVDSIEHQILFGYTDGIRAYAESLGQNYTRYTPEIWELARSRQISPQEAQELLRLWQVGYTDDILEYAESLGGGYRHDLERYTSEIWELARSKGILPEAAQELHRLRQAGYTDDILEYANGLGRNYRRDIERYTSEIWELARSRAISPEEAHRLSPDGYTDKILDYADSLGGHYRGNVTRYSPTIWLEAEELKISPDEVIVLRRIKAKYAPITPGYDTNTPGYDTIIPGEDAIMGGFGIRKNNGTRPPLPDGVIVLVDNQVTGVRQVIFYEVKNQTITTSFMSKFNYIASRAGDKKLDIIEFQLYIRRGSSIEDYTTDGQGYLCDHVNTTQKITISVPTFNVEGAVVNGVNKDVYIQVIEQDFP